jgi:hypothetical protein
MFADGVEMALVLKSPPKKSRANASSKKELRWASEDVVFCEIHIV